MPGGADVAQGVIDLKTGRFVAKTSLLEVIQTVTGNNKFLLLRNGFKIFDEVSEY